MADAQASAEDKLDQIEVMKRIEADKAENLKKIEEEKA